MFSGWTRTLHEISIFHHPTSPPSVKALGLLRSALSAPYPPGKGSAPLQFNLEVVESPPNADQLSTILSFLPSRDSAQSVTSAFLSAHPSAAGSSDGASAAAVSRLGMDRPSAFKWPVVVDWNAGRASVGDVEGVKGILELLRQKRDGETGEE